MKLFFIDDSNISYDKKLDFFIYGGLLGDAKDISDLSRNLYKIKEREGIDKKFPIKWPNSKWQGKELDKDLHDKLKDEILKVVSESNCKIIIYLAPQDFYHELSHHGTKFKLVINTKKLIRSFKFALNVCFQKFNQYLIENDNFGIIFVDDFGTNCKKELIEYCFNLYPKGTEKSKLERIVYPIIFTSNECSPIHQINDIVLGAIQYSLREATRNFLPIIKKNFWVKNISGRKQVGGYGVNLYPQKTPVAGLKNRLKQLENKFIRLVNSKN